MQGALPVIKQKQSLLPKINTWISYLSHYLQIICVKF